MKLIIQNDRIAATATDEYTGPEQFMPAPEGFDESRVSEYRLIEGQVLIPAPAAVTMRQARLALLASGKLQAVNDTLAAMTGAAGEAARIEWEYAQEVRRDSLLVANLAEALTMTPAEVDELFIAGAGL